MPFNLAVTRQRNSDQGKHSYELASMTRPARKTTVPRSWNISYSKSAPTHAKHIERPLNQTCVRTSHVRDWRLSISTSRRREHAISVSSFERFLSCLFLGLIGNHFIELKDLECKAEYYYVAWEISIMRLFVHCFERGDEHRILTLFISEVELIYVWDVTCRKRPRSWPSTWVIWNRAARHVRGVC
jgi:hypothetical protein